MTDEPEARNEIASPRPGELDRRRALQAGATALVAAAGAPSLAAGAAARRSAFGVYEGYSQERFDGWKRSSVFIATRDGVRLAADIFRPTLRGELHREPLPVIWEPKRYQRAVVGPDGKLRTAMESRIMDTQALLRHGYVVAAVDRRGTGASFGTRSEFSDPADALDGYDVTEWFAEQPWSTERVGMFGASYEGEMQLRVAGTAPPHLRAIMPEVAPFDWYWIVHPGGIHRSFKQFGELVRRQDLDPRNAPVDADADGALLKAALAEHQGNDYKATEGVFPFRDSVNPALGKPQWSPRHGGNFAEGLSRSGIATYHRVGWFAGVLIDQLAWFVNQTAGPKKMMIGPWGGRGVGTPEELALWTTEALRFFDHWLKGVRNGVMDEPPIHSSIPSAHVRAGSPWRGLSQWPPADQRPTAFYFAEGPAGAVGSVNDGRLAPQRPAQPEAHDDYQVKFGLAYGPTRPNQPTDPVPQGRTPVDHADFDAQGLTYTSAPLPGAMEITGHPVVRLWLTSSARDGDFFVKLQDVDESGASTYITDGALRASRRALADPPYNFFGAPWVSCREDQVQELPAGRPTELVITLNPTSYLLRPGHRFRVTITGSDAAIGATPVLDPAPIVRLFRNRTHSSSITLPVIPGART